MTCWQRTDNQIECSQQTVTNQTECEVVVDIKSGTPGRKHVRRGQLSGLATLPLVRRAAGSWVFVKPQTGPPSLRTRQRPDDQAKARATDQQS
jgi:hypothetical protein